MGLDRNKINRIALPEVVDREHKDSERSDQLQYEQVKKLDLV